MSKVVIHSDNPYYGQYLKSLVSQAGPVVEEFTQIADFWSGVMSLAGLIIVGADSDKHLKSIFDYDGLLDSPVFIVTGNGHGIKIRPGWKVFSKPLNGSDFVRSVHHWAQQEKLSVRETCPPYEPFLIGNHPSIHELRRKIARVSDSRVSVLVSGETGTGKGVVAQAIHNGSHRKNDCFLALNCATVPANLLESELFGYKKGAFTGAWKDKSGMFELVGEGTMFLDEISEMSPCMQAKLLQVLQENEFYPLGGDSLVRFRARVIAATNADLKQAMLDKRFRSDLYYRLAVVCLDLPPLKDRIDDIPVLGHYFLDKYCRMYNKDYPDLSNELWLVFKAYDWPGNVRELENTIKNMVVMEDETAVRDELIKKIPPELLPDLDKALANNSDRDIAFDQTFSLKKATQRAACQAEADLIVRTLDRTGGNKKDAAAVLDVSYKILLRKIKTYGL